MITKRHIYEPLERVESAIEVLAKLAMGEDTDRIVSSKIREVIRRDLSEAREKLSYAMDVTP